jgi:hypothetical protein
MKWVAKYLKLIGNEQQKQYRKKYKIESVNQDPTFL